MTNEEIVQEAREVKEMTWRQREREEREQERAREAKRTAAQIYDQYWSDVSRRPASNKDPLPDIRPLIEKALIEAEAKGAKTERERCATAVEKEIERWDRESVVELRESIMFEIRARSES